MASDDEDAAGLSRGQRKRKEKKQARRSKENFISMVKASEKKLSKVL